MLAGRRAADIAPALASDLKALLHAAKDSERPIFRIDHPLLLEEKKCQDDSAYGPLELWRTDHAKAHLEYAHAYDPANDWPMNACTKCERPSSNDRLSD